MHRLLVTAALALTTLGFTAAAQQAQQQAGPEQQNRPAYRHIHRKQDPHKVAMRMGQRLNLSADQTARLEPILASRQQKMEALRADGSLTPEARRSQFRAIHEDTKQQLASVLNADQMAQLKAMHREHHRHHSAPMQPADTPAA